MAAAQREGGSASGFPVCHFPPASASAPDQKHFIFRQPRIFAQTITLVPRSTGPPVNGDQRHRGRPARTRHQIQHQRQHPQSNTRQAGRLRRFWW